MMENQHSKELLCELKSQHKRFANEIILKLKNCYRLYEDDPYPKEFLFASSKICDAIIAISYLIRYHYRGVYYYLYNELTDVEGFEKFCFSLPVSRSKRYTFNFLLRISFVFEIAMYLFKAGYDYFYIARKCFSSYPDLLYFHAAGGWARLNNISTYILHVTKVSKPRIVAEHPLVGSFIERRGFYDPVLSCYFYEPVLLMDQKDVPTFPEEFFNPKETQALRVLHKHFLASPKPKYKFNAKDLLKFHEIFPLKNRVPFRIENESNIHSYIVYKLYIEIQEIHTFFQTFMDAETLKMYPSNSGNKVDDFRFECFDSYNIKISQQEIEAEFGKLDRRKQKQSLPHAFYEENLQIFQYMKSAGNILECCLSEQEIINSESSKSSLPDECEMEILKNIEAICENVLGMKITDEFDDSDLYTTEEELEQLPDGIFQTPKYTLIYADTENTKIMKGGTESLNEEDSKNPQSSSSTSDKSTQSSIEELSKIPQLTSSISDKSIQSPNEISDFLQSALDESAQSSSEEISIIPLSASNEEISKIPLSASNEERSKIHLSSSNEEFSKFSLSAPNEQISKNPTSASNEEMLKNPLSLSNDEFSKIPLSTSNEIISKFPLSSSEEISKLHQSTSNEEISKIPHSTTGIAELPKDKKLELIQLLMDITRLSRENKEILTNALPTNPIMQYFDQIKEQKSERGLSSVLENMTFVSTATKHLFFRILGECSEFSTEERNELCRLLVNIPEDMASGKTDVFQIINNMSCCTDQEKSDLIKSIMDLTKEEFDELHHSCTDDMKIVDVFEGIFNNNEDDDICEEFRQFVLLCQNEGEVDLDKFPEIAASSIEEKYPERELKKTELTEALSAKSTPEQLSQENYFSDNDDHTICRCFEKGKLAAQTFLTSITSSNKSVDEPRKNSDVANSSGNRRNRKANKKSKKRSKK